MVIGARDERRARVGEGEELVEHRALGAQRRSARRAVEHAAQQPHDVRPRGVVGQLDEADAEAGRGGPTCGLRAAARRSTTAPLPTSRRALEQGGRLGRTLDADAEQQVAGLAEDARPRLGERHVVDGRAARVDDDGEQASAEGADELRDRQAHRGRRRGAGRGPSGSSADGADGIRPSWHVGAASTITSAKLWSWQHQCARRGTAPPWRQGTTPDLTQESISCPL